MLFTPPTLHDGPRWRGMRVGLMGGSFNPPHDGHLHISHLAAQALALDCVWWLVTPHNPLKDPRELLPFADRMARCRALTAATPQVVVSDAETRLGTNLTWRTLAALVRLYPDTDFVWVTGMDNALTMHRWHNWRAILATMATAHIARPPALNLVRNCPLRLLRSQNHVMVGRGAAYALRPHTSFWIRQTPMVDQSSTKLRNLKRL